MTGIENIDPRESDIQKLCDAVLELTPTSTGDSGSGAICPFCYIDCRWDTNSVRDIKNHELHCPVLIAKDLKSKP